MAYFKVGHESTSTQIVPLIKVYPLITFWVRDVDDPGFDPLNLGVWSEDDNHYTTQLTPRLQLMVSLHCVYFLRFLRVSTPLNRIPMVYPC